jgi:hypothetical protein
MNPRVSGFVARRIDPGHSSGSTGIFSIDAIYIADLFIALMGRKSAYFLE